MAVTIVATAGSSTANSYITLADAKTVLGKYLSMYTSAWDTATDDQKSQALIQATRDIDSLNLRGAKYKGDYPHSDSSYQALHFPTAEDDSEIPPEVERATCLQAAFLLRSGAAKIATSDMIASGVKSQGIGHFNTTISKYASDRVCSEAAAEMRDWIVYGAKIERR